PPRRRPSMRARCGPSPAGNDSGVDPDRRRELTRFGAPAAFLAAATVAVLLIKAGLNHGADTAANTAGLPTTTTATTHATTITKLMTVIVALDHARWNDVVRVRADAADVGESTVNLRVGERITVGDLVKAALIQSANDAADALADYVGHGDTDVFVKLMNAK